MTMLIKPEGDNRPYCGKCELPREICACAEARAYDKANPIKERHNCSYSSSTLIGGSASCATFRCNVCGEEWEKDVS